MSSVLIAALELRSSAHTCPPEFIRRCAAIPFFASKGSAAASRSDVRSGGEPRGGEPRFSAFSDASSFRPASEDGFEQVQARRNNGRRGGGGGGGGYPAHGGAGYSSSASRYGGNGGGNQRAPLRGNEHRGNDYTPKPREDTVFRAFGRETTTVTTVEASRTIVTTVTTIPSSSVPSSIPSSSIPSSSIPSSSPSSIASAADPVALFTSEAVRSGVSSAMRVTQRAKGKLNRMGFGTYDSTKASMREMLDGDEVDFLDEILAFAFEKAATESLYCALFAKLLHELSEEFPHFKSAMRKLFDDYTRIFSEEVAAPEKNTEAYKQWLAEQEKKTYRRGYSQFVAELVKLGEADSTAFSIMLQNSVTVLEASKNDASKVFLCEEYGDCLATMCYAAATLLSEASWSADFIRRLDALSSCSLSTKPAGFSARGLFAIQNLVAFAKRGWKPL